MSTNIHNGYRVQGVGPTPDLDTLLERAWAAQTPVFEATEAVAVADAMERAVYERDRRWAGFDEQLDSDPRETGLYGSLFEHLRSIVQSSFAPTWSESEAAIDCRCHLVVMPAPDGGDALGMLFASDRRIAAAAEAALGLVPLPFWDSTDPPEEIDEEQWKLRGNLWDDALSRAPAGSGVPAANGLQFDLTAIRRVWPDPESLEAHMPRFDRRLEWIVRDLYIAERFAELCSDQNDPAKALGAVFAARDEMAEPGGARRVDELREQYRDVLPEGYATR